RADYRNPKVARRRCGGHDARAMAQHSGSKSASVTASVEKFVEEYRALCQPDSVFWCDGSEQEKEDLTREAVAQGILTPLNQEKLPGCYFHRSHSNDVARVEQLT